MSERSGFSSVMGFKLVGSGFRLFAGNGFSALDSVFKLVGMGFTKDDSRHELATKDAIVDAFYYFYILTLADSHANLRRLFFHRPGEKRKCRTSVASKVISGRKFGTIFGYFLL